MHNLALNTDEVQSVPYRVAYGANNWDLVVESTLLTLLFAGKWHLGDNI